MISKTPGTRISGTDIARLKTPSIMTAPAATPPDPRASVDDADLGDTDDDPPKDLDDFRIRLARRLAMMKQDWRHCPSAACRRARACVDDRLACQIRTATPELSDADYAEAKQELLVRLRREMRRRGLA